MIIERTQDKELIAGVLLHPALYEANTDDSHPAADFFHAEQVLLKDDIYYLAAKADELVGLFVFQEKRPQMYEAHANVLPHMRQFSREAGRASVRWMFQNTDAERLHVIIPVQYPNVFKYAMDMGFKLKKIIPDHVTKQGRSHDAYFMVRYN